MMRRFAVLLPILAGTCWGSAGVFVRGLHAAGFDNVTITFSRVMVVFVLIGLFILVYDRSLLVVSRRDLPLLALSGVSGFFLMNLCYNISITTLSMSLASVLLCTAPVFVILLGRVLFGEKITPLKVVCMLAALAGCVLLSGIVESGGLQWSLFGIAMGVASSLCNAVNTLTVNEVTDVRRVHPLIIQLYTGGIAMLLMAPMVDFPVMVHFVADQPLYGGGFFLAHAFVVSLIPNLSFTMSFRYVESGVVSILASGAEPTAALVVGLLVFGEVPTALGVLGMVLTVGAMIVLTRRGK